MYKMLFYIESLFGEIKDRLFEFLVSYGHGRWRTVTN